MIQNQTPSRKSVKLLRNYIYLSNIKLELVKDQITEVIKSLLLLVWSYLTFEFAMTTEQHRSISLPLTQTFMHVYVCLKSCIIEVLVS